MGPKCQFRLNLIFTKDSLFYQMTDTGKTIFVHPIRKVWDLPLEPKTQYVRTKYSPKNAQELINTFRLYISWKTAKEELDFSGWNSLSAADSYLKRNNIGHFHFFFEYINTRSNFNKSLFPYKLVKLSSFRLLQFLSCILFWRRQKFELPGAKKATLLRLFGLYLESRNMKY